MFIIYFLLTYITFTSAARIPQIPPYLQPASLGAAPVKVTKPSLHHISQGGDFLQRYVCSQQGVNKRQDGTPGTMAVDKTELSVILQQLRRLVAEFEFLLEQAASSSETPLLVEEITLAPEVTTSTVVLQQTITIEKVITVISKIELPTTDEVTVTMMDTAVTTSVEFAPSIITDASVVQPTPSQIGNYTFNPQSKKNIAVYYGQSPLTSKSSLTAQCSDPDIDIAILAFVTSAKTNGNYPTVNFGAACNWDQTSEMQSQATGLLYCPDLAKEIETCQGLGKKVLLSIGGSTAQIVFANDGEAVAFATVLWKLFGPLGQIDLGLRPFGKAIIDGFDIDNEDNQPGSYNTFARTFRTLFSKTSSKSYYLSSAPQCPFPDKSNPTDMLLLCDFVFVQFYNNPSCDIGSSGYEASVKQWASALKGGRGKWFLGAPAWSVAGPTAYANIGGAKGMKNVASKVASMDFGNFGGVMFWAGPEGLSNIQGGKDIIAWAKAGLEV